ncbi:glutaminase [Parasphingorhabdus sp.]|uniref:glutaminase n=1 Tax=Parasphingorhabdus sp. TaxID=2709688 RepID=UPI0007F3A4F3|nr:glutaminase [Sphingomonadales bacterium EhC05]
MIIADQPVDWARALESIKTSVNPHIGSGKVADYIPALACVDPNKFGLAVALDRGDMHCLGDADESFSMQSISKVFTLALTLKQIGDELWKRVGREPSGSPFNSIVQLEAEQGIPRNPLINAGAIVTTDHLISAYGGGETGADQAMADLLQLFHRLADDDNISIDRHVAKSESDAGSRNRALAHFMTSFANMANPVEATLSAYFRHCSLAISCRQLARAALFLAFDGTDPVTGEQIVTKKRCRRILAVMMSSGHYDNSGDFAYRIGLPGKSGVGGGILVVAPDHGTIAVWSPGLNRAGTSMVGSIALEELVRQTGWSVFG